MGKEEENAAFFLEKTSQLAQYDIRKKTKQGDLMRDAGAVRSGSPILLLLPGRRSASLSPGRRERKGKEGKEREGKGGIAPLALRPAGTAGERPPGSGNRSRDSTQVKKKNLP